jgi:hypothetical protein
MNWDGEGLNIGQTKEHMRRRQLEARDWTRTCTIRKELNLTVRKRA